LCSRKASTNSGDARERPRRRLEHRIAIGQARREGPRDQPDLLEMQAGDDVDDGHADALHHQCAGRAEELDMDGHAQAGRVLGEGAFDRLVQEVIRIERDEGRIIEMGRRDDRLGRQRMIGRHHADTGNLDRLDDRGRALDRMLGKTDIEGLDAAEIAHGRR